LCLVRLAERPNRHAGNDLVDSLRLAGVTGDGYSLVDMQSGAVANDLAFVQYDLALINADYGPQLVVEELLPSVFDVFREPDPVADQAPEPEYRPAPAPEPEPAPEPTGIFAVDADSTPTPPHGFRLPPEPDEHRGSTS